MINYLVMRIPGGEGKAFIRKHHYSHSCHNGPMTWGLFDGLDLIGVLAFATPCSENVRRSVFGPDRANSVTELHRLVILDETPTNTESWFIAQCLRALKRERPQYQAVLSFADETEGHRGVIYQATNAIYAGTTGRAKFYRDPEGRLRHPRQSGVNITADMAVERGWTPEMRDAKHRYLWVLGSPAERRTLRRQVLLPSLPYPKALVLLDDDGSRMPVRHK